MKHNVSSGEVNRFIGLSLNQWTSNQICRDGRYDEGVCGYGGEGAIPCKHGYTKHHEIPPLQYGRPKNYCTAICYVTDVLGATVIISSFTKGVVKVVVSKDNIIGEYASDNLGVSVSYALYDFFKSWESRIL